MSNGMYTKRFFWSPDGSWKAEYDPDEETLLISRADGWSLEYRDGTIRSMTTDDGRVVEWGVVNGLTDSIRLAGELPSLQVERDSGGVINGIKVNGDLYEVDLAGGTLSRIGLPDGSEMTMTTQSVTAWNGQPATKLTVTDRYGVAESFEFAIAGGELYSDGVWNYENLGQYTVSASAEWPPLQASRKRTRISTGETESELFDSNNGVEIYTDVRDVQTTVLRFTTPGQERSFFA